MEDSTGSREEPQEIPSLVFPNLAWLSRYLKQMYVHIVPDFSH